MGPAESKRAPKRGPGRPPDSIGEETKEAIARAARTLFAHKGYFATTTRMIAAEVELTPAALHHHFGRKHELALAVWHATMDTEYARLNAAVDEQDTFVNKVRAVLDVSHQETQRDRDSSIFITLMREEARRTEELREILDDTRTANLIRSIVELGLKTGEVDKASAPAVRGAISAVSMGATVLAMDLAPQRVEAMIDGCKRLFDGTLLNSR